MLLLFAALSWASPALLPPSVPATGHQEAEIEAEDFGRYAIEVRSPRGTSVQLVDKMQGPGPRSGQAGEADGRLDLFLEAGRSKLWLESDPTGEGQATLTATRFRELHGTELPLLLPLREERGTLGDHEQRSWWIDVPARQSVDLEAAARHLGDLRLWQDGTWLHASEPRCTAFEPVEGQAWTRCQLSTLLEPGLYRVTAYGGPSRPWTQASDASPFWLRLGVPVIGSPSEHTLELDEKGYARMRVVEPRARRARLSLPENAANASVGHAAGIEGFRSGHRWAEITDESRTPEATLSFSGPGEICVRGAPGQEITLQVLPAPEWSRTLEPGPHALTSLVGGHPADVLDPTAAVVWRDREGKWKLRQAYPLLLDSGRRYERRFNLLATATLLVDVPSTGSWEFAVRGDAQLKVEPLLLNRPPRYESPPLKGPSVTQDLDAGLYVVTLVPTKPGVVTLDIAPDTWTRSAQSLIGRDLPLMRSMRTKLQDLAYRGQNGDSLMVFGPSDTSIGTDVRPLPATVEQPLSLVLEGRETLVVPIRTPGDGVVEARTATGDLLYVRVDQGPWMETLELPASGDHTIEVTNPEDERLRVSLSWTARTHLPSTPPPALTPERLASVPVFEEVSARTPVFADLDRGEVRTFDVRVTEPGLYSLTSTGLLATSGALRTRVRTRFDGGDQNGVGRNFLVDRYLGIGAYQLSVAPVGASRGHLGVELKRATLHAGGPLIDGEPARATVRAGDAVAYTLEVPEEGSYRIESLGLGRTFQCRIEDADGYPITSPPERDCALTLALRQGAYSVITSPERTESRRLTRAQRVVAESEREAPGPYALRLGQSERATWLEPADREAPRTPQQWTFTLPAAASVAVHLDDAMTGTLHGPAGELGRVLPGQEFERVLEPGEYRLDVLAARRDHGLSYRLRIDPWEMVAGMERSVRAPEELPISVGGNGSFTVASFGTTDVRATLLDERGEVIARSDDRPDDWNFRIERRIEPGTYTLRVDPVAGGSASTHVRMTQPPEIVQPPVASGKPIDLLPGTSVHTFPVERSPRDVVLAHATSTESLGVAVEVAEEGRWRTLTTATGRDVAVPAWPGEGEVRVRLWSLDPRGATARLVVSAQSPQRVQERSLASGVRAGGRAPLSPVAARVDPGVFLLSKRESLWQCDATGACTSVEAGQLATTTDGLRLFVAGTLAAERIALDHGDSRSVLIASSGERPVDVATHSGPVAVVARARAGVPVVRLHHKASDETPRFGAVGLAERATIAVALDGSSRFALVGSSDGAPLDARLSATHFAVGKPQALDASGALELALGPLGAEQVRLGKGPHELRLTLDAGVAVALSTGDDVDRVLWADEAPRSFSVITDAREATVLHTGQAEGAIARIRRADALLADRVVDDLSATWASPDASTRVLRVSPGGQVSVSGGSARLLLDSGRIVPFDGAVDVSGGGTAWVDAHPGVGALHKHNASEEPTGRGRKLTPGTEALSGQEEHLTLEGRGLLELGLNEPVEVLVHGSEARRHLLPDGGWVRMVAAEAVQVTIRPLASRILGGTATLRVSEPVAMGEGLGPEILLGPGEARAFSFEVPRDGPIGIGVRATADRVQATLYGEGAVLGAGLVQMTDVTTGRYVLVLHLPGDASPVRARPVLTGISPPDTGPPEEVVRRYLELASEAP